jgi:hypothetical protein
MAKSYYIDTSIVRSYLVGHSEIKKLLVNRLKNKTVLTSKFVKCEFERKFVCDLIAFYFVLKKQKTFADACDWWSEEFGARKLKNFQAVCTKVFLNAGNDKRRALFNLGEAIKAILVSFDFLIHRFENDNAHCYMSSIDINFEATKRADIEKEFFKFYNFFNNQNYVANCEIIKLFGDSQNKIKEMLARTTTNKGFNRQKIIVDGLTNKGKNFSCNKCKVIGDTVIALECPDFAILLTQDDAFDELCPVLGKKFEKVPSLRALLPTATVLSELRGRI